MAPEISGRRTPPALRSLQISGVFTTDGAKTFVAFLHTLPGVRVEETATRIRVLQEITATT